MWKPKEVIEFFELLVQKFGLPGWTIKVLLIVFLLGVVLFILDWVLKKWDSLKPRFYNNDQKKRVLRRQRFANHLAGEIERINRKEDWDDYHFTELEAEVEAEGRRRVFSFIPFLKSSRSGLRREKSLSKAIKNSSEKIIQLEGDPGSGKSVALRHLALKMAKSAASSKSLKSVIPLFVNLKELSRIRDEKIDRNLIEAFVLKTLKRVNDRNVEEFLDREFYVGMEEHSWFFLFDSFDEIPEVLSSTEEDDIIKSYSDAISDFLGGLNNCRGVVASRQYRGPNKSGWAKFRIMELSESRRIKLIENADLESHVENELKAQVDLAVPEIRELSKNPMLLSLLCIHLKVGNPFPQSAHTVLATYLENRLDRDRDRLKKRFRIEPKEIREFAEKAAFCMAADSGLGLTPSRQALAQSMANLGTPIRDTARFNILLDGLEYIKLGRSENDDGVGESRLFTFAHRRFQEYFATCVALREPNRINAQQLLCDARWRETAVVIFQTQPKEALSLLLDEVQRMLSTMINGITITSKVTFDDLTKISNQHLEENNETRQEVPITKFPWPPESLHLLSLLQDGFSRRINDLPKQIREDIGVIVLSASESAYPFDEYWALEVAGVAESKVLLELLRRAFASHRQLLKDIAFRQVSRLDIVPEDIAKSISQALVNLCTMGNLGRVYLATRAHVSRLTKGEAFLSTLRLLAWTSRIDISLHIFFFIALLIFTSSNYIARLRGIPINTTKEYLLISTSLILSLLTAKVTSLKFASRRPISFAILLRTSVFLYMITSLLTTIPYSSKRTINLQSKKLPHPTTILFDFMHTVTNKRFATAACTVLCIWLLTIWVYISIAAARYGHFSGKIWGPFIPLAPIIIIVKGSGEIFSDIHNQFRWSAITRYCLFLPIYFWCFVYFMNWLTAAPQPIKLFAALACVVATMLFLFPSLIWLNDRIKWIKRNPETSPINAQEFAQIIQRYRTGNHIWRGIREVRLQGILRPTPNTQLLISQLAIAIVEQQKNRWRTRHSSRLKNWSSIYILRETLLSNLRLFRRAFSSQPVIIVGETDLIDWYNTLFKEYRDLLIGWEGDILDELCQLQNQLTTNHKITIM